MLSTGEHLLSLNGADQWVGVSGAGPVPLVVLHGGPGAHNYVFERTVSARIAATRPLVLHEQRGCGRSPGADAATFTRATLVADVLALLDAIGTPVDLLGWSFGADLAARVAHARPEAVHGLVLQAPALDPTEDALPDFLVEGFIEVAEPGLAARLAQVRRENVPAWERFWRAAALLDQATVDRAGYRTPEAATLAHRLEAESGLRTNLAMLEAITAEEGVPSVRAQLGDIVAPTLVLTGAHDRNVSPVTSREIAAEAHGADLVVLEGSAHMPHVDEPEAYLAALLGWLSRG